MAGEAGHGDEAAERELEALREELGLGDRLRLLGFRSDVGTLLGAADVVAIPSLVDEPPPLPALEAAFAGVPVVASRFAGTASLVADGETGVLVERGDEHALATALRGLADDPSLARRLGETGAERLREGPGMAATVAALEERFERLAGGADAAVGKRRAAGRID